MRDLTECKAEVFRRSERRIQARRKARNRILACCIPLCLAVAVWCAASLPAGDKGIPPENEMATGSLVCSYTQVEILAANRIPTLYEKVTDKVEVTKIFSSIHALFPDQDAGDGSVGGLLTDCVADYTVIFQTEDGSQTVYALRGNMLRNVNTDEEVTLSDAQMAELLTALGIKEESK